MLSTFIWKDILLLICVCIIREKPFDGYEIMLVAALVVVVEIAFFIKVLAWVAQVVALAAGATGVAAYMHKYGCRRRINCLVRY